MNENEIEMLHIYPVPDGVADRMERDVMARLRFYAEHRYAMRCWYKRESYKPEGMRHSFPSCIHGMSRWTDYDNICAWCEDGYQEWDAVREVRDAYDHAVYVVKEYKARREAMTNMREVARTYGQVVDADLLAAMATWVAKALD